MKIPFKYKLSFSISLIVTGVLTGVFLFLQADIEEDNLVRVKEQLTTSRELVSDLIEARRTHLYELATCVGESEGCTIFSPTRPWNPGPGTILSISESFRAIPVSACSV